jgi:hemoglobin
MELHEVYAAVGDEGFQRLIAAFYAQIPADPILSPMYPPEDMQGAEDRLRWFLVYRFGGPQDYLTQRGHPRLRMRHAPFTIDQAAAERWVALMDNAFAQVDWPDEPQRVAREFLAQTALFLVNR